MIKTVSVLALVALSSTSTVSAQPKLFSDPSLIQTLTSVGLTWSRPVGHVFAVAPPHSAACDSCMDANVNNIPDCHNIPLTPGATSVSDLNDQEKKCFCTWAKTPSSTWSQGCVTPTLCSQAVVDYVASGLVLLELQTCVSGSSLTPSSGANSGVTSRSQKSSGGAIAAAALAMGAAAAMF